jgi:hypothetical protein
MTNKHPHAEMIKAKAYNMDLVVFERMAYGGDWSKMIGRGFISSFHPENDYFTCLPQHKEACLHWLNGGDAQAMNYGWVDISTARSHPWKDTHCFMRDDIKIRIKPLKEKRWVVVHDGRLVGKLFKFDSDIRESYGAEYHDLQVFQIEIEV